MNLFKKLYRYFFRKKEIKPVIPIAEKKKVKPKRKKRIRTKCYVVNKINYSEEKAKEQVKKITRSKLRAYKCEFCDYWHLTHHKRRK